MQLSYLLITTNPGCEQSVGEALLMLDEIKHVNMLYGKYDIIAKIQAKNVIELQENLISSIQKIRGVELVKNLMVNHG
ncbi:MAG: Lrp/AsnC ligand binding domain-containing protein [Nanoarchaeota archaeon]